MQIRQLTPSKRSDRRHFIALGQRFAANEPLHVPELAADLDARFRGRSPAYDTITFELFVASDGGRDVARCAAFINRCYQQRHGDVGFIGYFAAAPDAREAVVVELIGRAERWLRERGVSRVIAPHNGAALHGVGLQTSAFDESPMFPMAWNAPRLAGLLEAAGYEAVYPLWVYEVDLTSDVFRQRAAVALDAPHVTVRCVDKRRWRQEMVTLHALFDTTFRDHWEFHEHTFEEWMELWGKLKHLIDPSHAVFAEVDGTVLGFCFGLSDLTPLFRSFRGKMGPLQVLRMLMRSRTCTRAGLFAGGVLEDARGTGVAPAMAATVLCRYQALGLKSALYYPVNDDNKASRALAESFGARGRSLYHGFERTLS